MLCEKVRNGVDVHSGRWVKGIYLTGVLVEISHLPQHNRKKRPFESGVGYREGGEEAVEFVVDGFAAAVPGALRFRASEAALAEMHGCSTNDLKNTFKLQLNLSTVATMQKACTPSSINGLRTAVQVRSKLIDNSPFRRHISDITVTRTGKPIIRTQGGR